MINLVTIIPWWAYVLLAAVFFIFLPWKLAVFILGVWWMVLRL
jgi:hypothetical protein